MSNLFGKETKFDVGSFKNRRCYTKPPKLLFSFCVSMYI